MRYCGRVTEQLSFEGHERPLSVSQVIACLRDALEEFSDVWIEGEIGSLHRSRLGHLYFDLKDEDGQLRAVLFRAQAQQLAIEPEEGMQVRVHARVDIYPERGTLQLIVESLEPAGAGALRVAFEKLKARLHAEGIFDPEHKKPLPPFPRRIGLSRRAPVQPSTTSCVGWGAEAPSQTSSSSMPASRGSRPGARWSADCTCSMHVPTSM